MKKSKASLSLLTVSLQIYNFYAIEMKNPTVMWIYALKRDF